MSSLERIGPPDHHAQNPSFPVVSRATHADSARAPSGDDTPTSGPSTCTALILAPSTGQMPQGLTLAPTGALQPPCTARARTPWKNVIENDHLSPHVLVEFGLLILTRRATQLR